MIASNTTTPRVAVIRNLRIDDGVWGQEMLDSFDELILASQPNAIVERFHAIAGGELPDATKYDLIILSGGTYDLTKDDRDPWVVKLVKWIKDAVENSPSTRLLGICWGHQVISLALGGQVGYLPGGRVVSMPT